MTTLMQLLQYDSRLSAAKDKSITHAAVAPSNLDAAITLRSATTDSRNTKNYAHSNNHSLQNREDEHIRDRNDRPAAHTRYLSSPAAATLLGKIQGFVLQSPCNIHAAITTWLNVLLCDVKSHTTVWHHPSLSVFFYVMSSIIPQSHTTLHWVY